MNDPKCSCGGTGIRAALRSLWSKDRAGSTPVNCTKLDNAFRPARMRSMNATEADVEAMPSDEEDIAALYAAYRDGYYGVAYEWVPIKDIAVPGYQREQYQGHIKTILKKFVPGLVAPPLVNKLSRKRKPYDAVDGQHTIEVLRAIGVDEIYCRVVDMTYQDAAHAFGVQTSKALKRTEKFFSRVEAGELDAIAIRNAMERQDFTPQRAGYSGNCLQVKAMFEVEKTVRNYGLTHLEDTLAFIQLVWPLGDKRESGYFIRGVADFLSRYTDLTDEHVSRLKSNAPQDYLMAGSGMGAQDHRVHAIMLKLREVALRQGGKPRKRSIWSL